MKNLVFILLFLTLIVNVNLKQWSLEKAQEWYTEQGWLAGCNFIPSTAENTIEMWQEETFDVETIDTELGYAEYLGFNIIRVFLHFLVWQQNPARFRQRMDAFLKISISHKIKTMFVLFDDDWDPNPHLGPQEPPIPGLHNSRWVQCPGSPGLLNTTMYPLYRDYVIDVLSSFAEDPRIAIWDLYNEPGAANNNFNTFPLLKNVYAWAREANVSQPLTTPVSGISSDNMSSFQLNNSDIITIHSYDYVEIFIELHDWVVDQVGKRPIFVSEYMARTLNCTFFSHMRVMKSLNLGAINWGLVSGKTQTIFPWGSKPGSPTPKIWFHDILYKNGSAFDENEILFIRNLTLPLS